MQTKKSSEISYQELETYIGIVLYDDGSKHWYLNGKLHRTDGPAIEYADGSKEYYLDGKVHRTDGPAIEFVNGSKYWYLDGQRHRTDGSAIEWSDGNKSWWYQDRCIDVNSQEEFESWLKVLAFE